MQNLDNARNVLFQWQLQIIDPITVLNVKGDQYNISLSNDLSYVFLRSEFRISLGQSACLISKPSLFRGQTILS